MSELDNGIKQPIRIYDDISKQNWRREWVHNGLSKRKVILNPYNSILPFQLRRKTSPDVITDFDLYRFNEATGAFEFYVNLLTIIPAPLSDHLKIAQMQPFDNIIWRPRNSFTSNLICGYYYFYISDGTIEGWSEVFHVSDEFPAIATKPIVILSDSTVLGSYNLESKPGTVLNASNNIF